MAAKEGESSMAPSSPWERPAAARPAQSCPGELGGHQERGAQTDVSPWEWLDTRPARSCQGGNAELPTTPIKDAAPPYISIGRGAKYIWIITKMVLLTKKINVLLVIPAYRRLFTVSVLSFSGRDLILVFSSEDRLTLLMD